MMNQNKKTNFKKKSPPRIALNVNFQEVLSRESLTNILIELFKALLHQRHQIPVGYSILQSDIKNHRNDFGIRDSFTNLKPREAAKLQRSNLQAKKLHDRYVRNAKIFSDKVDNITEQLENEMTQKDLETVTFLFGATPVSPKEIYHVHLPEYYSNCNSGSISNAQRQLFRSLVTHEALFNQIGKPLGPTNVYLAVKQKYLQPNSSCFLPRPSLSRTQHRGSIVEFNLLVPETYKTPFSKLRRFDTPRETYTPVPMELCTPFTITKPTYFRSNRRCENDSITPIKKFKPSKLTFVTEEDSEDCVFEEDFVLCEPNDEERRIDDKVEDQQVPNVLMTENRWFIFNDSIRGIKCN